MPLEDGREIEKTGEKSLNRTISILAELLYGTFVSVASRVEFKNDFEKNLSGAHNPRIRFLEPRYVEQLKTGLATAAGEMRKSKGIPPLPNNGKAHYYTLEEQEDLLARALERIKKPKKRHDELSHEFLTALETHIFEQMRKGAPLSEGKRIDS
jgi:hypothetical protein